MVNNNILRGLRPLIFCFHFGRAFEFINVQSLGNDQLAKLRRAKSEIWIQKRQFHQNIPHVLE